MYLRILALTLTGLALSTLAHAHPSKCQHSHAPGGRIIWEEACGGTRSATSPDARRGHQAEAERHPPHNMLLLGRDEIFASHIVYKAPHNYQVILKLRLPEKIRGEYLALRERNPEADLVFLLDEMDISRIASASTLSGTIRVLRGTGDFPRITLDRDQFDLVFFNELPLSLENAAHH